MKFKHIIWTLISSITLLTSCVDEDVVFAENSANLESSLHSIGEGDSFNLNVEFRDFNGDLIENLSDFNIEYTSDNPNLLTVDQSGRISAPVQNTTANNRSSREGNTVTIRVNASNSEFIFPEITNDIIVGAVTITERELIFKENDLRTQFEEEGLSDDEIEIAINEELTTLINEGYDPRVIITNPNIINTIALTNSEEIQYNAVYQNLRREVVDADILWESSDSSILEVDQNGIITPVSIGTASIIASFNNSSFSTPIINITLEETETPEEPIIEEPIIEPPLLLGFGQLQSNSFYDVSGSFQIVRENGVTTINLDNEYATGNVPDLVIYLSNVTNTNNGAAFISEDITSSGEQSFIIPDSINPDDYINVLIYCRRFGARVGFGVINR